MADALSAASLLLAALALVYGAWSGDIEREAGRSYSANATTKGREKDATRAVLWGKAVPLAAAGWTILAVFAWRVLTIVRDTVGQALAGTWRYGDVQTIFVLATLLILGLALHLTGRIVALRKTLKT